MADILTPDICVVGGGPGGISAALAAVAEGASVVLLEKAALGGANLATGTIPSKALVAAAEVFEAVRAGAAVGVVASPLQVNLPKVRDHAAAVAETVASRLSAERLAALGVTVIAGAARFTDPHSLAVGDRTIRPRGVVLAVGSVPIVPDIPGIETVEYATTAGGIDLTRKPAHLLILGAGGHALELAQAYTRLSIDATAVDSSPALPEHDPELAAIVVERLRAEGIRVRAGSVLRSVARRRGGIRLVIDDPAEGEVAVDASHLLVAAGRTADVTGLGLAEGRIRSDAAGILVDRHLRTANPRVYAIGDAIAGVASAARAERQGRSAVRSLLLPASPTDDAAAAPFITFTDPPIATVGLSEADARARHPETVTHRFPFVDNDRAAIERAPFGFIKVMATPSGRILGAAIVGRGADEMISLWSLAIANRLPLGAMAALDTGYPTRAAISRRVAEGAAPRGLTPSWRRRIIGWLGKLG